MNRKKESAFATLPTDKYIITYFGVNENKDQGGRKHG